MSYEIKDTTVFVKVSGWPAMANVNNPDAGQFIPAYLRINIVPGYPINIDVSGPMLNPKTGMPYKSKTGMGSFEEDDIKDRTAPAELLEIVDLITGRTAAK